MGAQFLSEVLFNSTDLGVSPRPECVLIFKLSRDLFGSLAFLEVIMGHLAGLPVDRDVFQFGVDGRHLLLNFRWRLHLFLLLCWRLALDGLLLDHLNGRVLEPVGLRFVNHLFFLVDFLGCILGSLLDLGLLFTTGKTIKDSETLQLSRAKGLLNSNK